MDLEVWISPKGLNAALVPVPMPPPRDDEDGWFPEAADENPPRAYEMRVAGEAIWERIVFPYAPWSPYDAVADILVAEGWTPPASTDEELAECEHGMSARLCSGPMHY